MVSVCGRVSLFRFITAGMTSAFLLSACDSVGGNVGIAVPAVSYLGTRPGNEIEQIYYLGVFDPREQVPPQVYRVRIHGQASTISGVKFGSGWVPAPLIDSLGSEVSFANGQNGSLGSLDVGTVDDERKAILDLGRRQVLFGPEGFLEAPRDHRLVVVMGTNADEFFSAIDETLGTLARTDIEIQQGELHQKAVAEMLRLARERLALERLPDQTPPDPKPASSNGGGR